MCEKGYYLKQGKCSVKGSVAIYLKFLIEIRNETEHRSTNRIEGALGAKLQSCALNFNNLLNIAFGARYGIQKHLPLALHFVWFGAEHRTALKKASSLPKNLETVIEYFFEDRLTDVQIKDPAYRMSNGFVPMAAKKLVAVEMVVQIISRASTGAGETSKIIFKGVNKNCYTPRKIIKEVKAAGLPSFRVHHPTQLWQAGNAKKVAKGFGCLGDCSDT